MASLDDAAFHMYLGHIWARIGIGGALPELALGGLRLVDAVSSMQLQNFVSCDISSPL